MGMVVENYLLKKVPAMMKRNNKLSQPCFILLILFVLAFLPLSCSHTLNVNITEIGNYSQTLLEPLPINVGVYYGNDFRTYIE